MIAACFREREKMEQRFAVQFVSTQMQVDVRTSFVVLMLVRALALQLSCPASIDSRYSLPVHWEEYGWLARLTCTCTHVYLFICRCTSAVSGRLSSFSTRGVQENSRPVCVFVYYKAQSTAASKACIRPFDSDA